MMYLKTVEKEDMEWALKTSLLISKYLLYHTGNYKKDKKKVKKMLKDIEKEEFGKYVETEVTPWDE